MTEYIVGRHSGKPATPPCRPRAVAHRRVETTSTAKCASTTPARPHLAVRSMKSGRGSSRRSRPATGR
eukprot:3286905-Prymnesium_polylepis.1